MNIWTLCLFLARGPIFIHNTTAPLHSARPLRKINSSVIISREAAISRRKFVITQLEWLQCQEGGYLRRVSRDRYFRRVCYFKPHKVSVDMLVLLYNLFIDEIMTAVRRNTKYCFTRREPPTEKYLQRSMIIEWESYINIFFTPIIYSQYPVWPSRSLSRLITLFLFHLSWAGGLG